RADLVRLWQAPQEAGSPRRRLSAHSLASAGLLEYSYMRRVAAQGLAGAARLARPTGVVADDVDAIEPHAGAGIGAHVAARVAIGGANVEAELAHQPGQHLVLKLLGASPGQRLAERVDGEERPF